VIALYVAVAAAATLIAWAIVTYNALVRSRNKVDEAWSGIEVQLERRHDLVPNLVETVRGYAAHEREALGEVTRARADAVAASGPAQTERTEAELASAIGSVRVIAESYPELRASESFRRLQLELTEIEDEIQAARRIYNANVKDYNTRIGVFPDSLIASPLSFRARSFIEIYSASERALPQVAV
jgi:LemA protein